MPNRNTLYRLVDELPDSEIGRAQRVLAALLEPEGDLYTLDTAPEDDEPETPEERAAVEEARAEADRGELIPHDEAMGRLGLR